MLGKHLDEISCAVIRIKDKAHNELFSREFNRLITKEQFNEIFQNKIVPILKRDAGDGEKRSCIDVKDIDMHVYQLYNSSTESVIRQVAEENGISCIFKIDCGKILFSWQPVKEEDYNLFDECLYDLDCACCK